MVFPMAIVFFLYFLILSKAQALLNESEETKKGPSLEQTEPRCRDKQWKRCDLPEMTRLEPLWSILGKGGLYAVIEFAGTYLPGFVRIESPLLRIC